MSRSFHSTTAKMILIISAFLSISSSSCSAFAPPHVSQRSSSTNGAHLSMASTLMESPRQSFEDRMRNAVLGGRSKELTTKSETMPANLKIASTLDDYKRIVGGERERVVVVRFYAPWCKVRISFVLVVDGALKDSYVRSGSYILSDVSPDGESDRKTREWRLGGLQFHYGDYPGYLQWAIISFYLRLSFLC